MLHRKGTVKYLSVLLMGGAMLLSGALLTQISLAQSSVGGGSVQTLEGVISDGMCGASHGGKDPVKCTQACVKNGMGWVLVVGDKVYTLEGRLAVINHLAGKKATVTGRVEDNKITATKVAIPG